MAVYKVELIHNGSPWWSTPWKAIIRDEDNEFVNSTAYRVTKWRTKAAALRLIKIEDRTLRTESYEVKTDS